MEEHPVKRRAAKLHAKDAAASNEIWLEVGRALTRWSMLEEALCSIFILCVCPRQDVSIRVERAAGAAFWAMASFDGKLKMTNAAVRQWLRDDDALAPPQDSFLHRCWNALFNNLGKKSPKRHDLAHGTVVTHYTEDAVHTAFVPSHFRRRYTSGAQEPLLNTGLSGKDIQQRNAGFAIMTDRLSKFEKALFEHLAQRGEVYGREAEASPPRHHRT
jgi:hypothetical protein